MKLKYVKSFLAICVSLFFAVAVGQDRSFEIDRRQDRLIAYSEAMQSWIEKICDISEEQRNELRTLSVAQISESQRIWQPKPRNQPLSDTAPLRFILSDGAARQVDLTTNLHMLKPILTDQQRVPLKDAVEERHAFQQKALIGQLLNVLDEELYLSGEQRATLTEQLLSSHVGRDFVAYSLMPLSEYYQQVSVISVLEKTDHLKLLNAVQRQRANDLAEPSMKKRPNNMADYIKFNSSNGIAPLLSALDDHGLQQRARVEDACALQASYWAFQWGLGEKDASHLRVAGKGVADELIADWKKKIKFNLRANAEDPELSGGTSWMSAVDLGQIENSEIWQHALIAVRPASATVEYDRRGAMHNAACQYLTAILDRELWLTADQRSRLSEIVATVVAVKPPRWDRNVPDIRSVVFPLFALSPADFELLNPAQRRALTLLKSNFFCEGDWAELRAKNCFSPRFHLPRKH